MPILLGLAALILLAVVFGPQLWIRHVLARHGVDRPDLPEQERSSHAISSMRPGWAR